VDLFRSHPLTNTDRILTDTTYEIQGRIARPRGRGSRTRTSVDFVLHLYRAALVSKSFETTIFLSSILSSLSSHKIWI
jgi:hypothetical protein